MAELKIKADSGGGTVSFKGPATTTSNAAVQLTLPVDDGTANQYLKTDGSGALSWATVDTSIADDSITEAKLDIHAAPSGTDKFLGYTSNGMEWAVPADSGAVIQVKNHKYTTEVEHTTTSETDTGSTIDITPTSSSNKILVIVSGNTRTDKTGGGDTLGVYKIYRDSTMIGEWYHGTYEASTSNRMVLTLGGTGLTILDAPATTSSITYKVTMKCIYGTHIQWSANALPSTITVMEVKP